MRFSTPEIAWHNRDPVYSLDIQPCLTITSSDQTVTKTVPFLPGVNADTFLTLPALTYGSYPPKAIKSDHVETLTYRVASAGADSTVVVWRIKVTFCHPAQKIKIDPVAQLTRHENAVNVLRFVPTGEDMFASASVDRTIIIWKKLDDQSGSSSGSQGKKSPAKREEDKKSPTKDTSTSDEPVPMDTSDPQPITKPVMTVKSGNRISLTTISNVTTTFAPPQPTPSPSFTANSDLICDEQWVQWKTFRGHLEDVVDISWSSDGLYILSGSVDNEAILWDVQKGSKLAFLSGHKGWVQGVAIDPLNNYLATLSCDRILRIFNFNDRKIVHKVEKAAVTNPGLKFADQVNDDLMSFMASSTCKSNCPPSISSAPTTPSTTNGNGKVDTERFTTKLFYDYTMQSFARRLFFSPNGEFLLVPSGVIEFPKPEKEKKEPMKDKEKENATNSVNGKVKESLDISVNGTNTPKSKSSNGTKCETPMDVSSKFDSPKSTLASPKLVASTPTNAKLSTMNSNTPKSAKSKTNQQQQATTSTEPGYINACHVFSRSNLSKPVAYFPLHNNYCHAVRFCPVKFSLLTDEDHLPPSEESNYQVPTTGGKSTFPLPYRLIFAIATHNSVLIYDTQHTTPIAYLTDIHYTRITDLTWSLDGRLLLISSTDGFVTFVTFDDGELGQIYVEPPAPPPPVVVEPQVVIQEQPANQLNSPSNNQPVSQPSSQSNQKNILQMFAAMGKAT